MSKIIYHATRNRFVHKIKKEGLRAKRKISYGGQVGSGLVYFATDMHCAASFVECADNIPDSWEDDKIVVLAVKVSDLDKRYFRKDPNILAEDDEARNTIAYENTVNPNLIGIINFKKKKIEPLTGLKRLSSEYYYE